MSTKNLLRPESVIFVTGGGRGVTARCAIEIAKYSHSQLILAGRTSLGEPEPAWAHNLINAEELKRALLAELQKTKQSLKPTEINRACAAVMARQEINATLESIRETSAKAEYVSVNVADLDSLKVVLEDITNRYGPITGVIHGAGSLADKRIENKTCADFAAVYDPKVKGLANLLECIPAGRLDFLALFSSIVSISGNPGQVDYAIANRTMDAAAKRIQRKNPSCRVLSINWGPWESGMVTPVLKRYFTSHGVNLISLNEGAQEFIHMLTDPELKATTQIIVGSAPPKARHLPSNSVQKILRTIRREMNPFLEDHQIGRRPVLPATCAAAWMAHSAEQVYPGMSAVRMEDYKVLKGLVFADDGAQEYITEIRASASSVDDAHVEVTVTSQAQAKLPLYHYSARFMLSTKPLASPEIKPPTITTTKGQPGEIYYRDGTCFHGPSFQGIQEVVEIDDTGLVMKAFLPQVSLKAQGQFQVRLANPFMNDVAVQSLLVWTQKRRQNPCLPSYSQLVELYQPLHFDSTYLIQLKIQSCTETAVVGDIIAWDSLGKMAIQIKGLQGTISPQLRRLLPTGVTANV